MDMTGTQSQLASELDKPAASLPWIIARSLAVQLLVFGCYILLVATSSPYDNQLRWLETPAAVLLGLGALALASLELAIATQPTYRKAALVKLIWVVALGLAIGAAESLYFELVYANTLIDASGTASTTGQLQFHVTPIVSFVITFIMLRHVLSRTTVWTLPLMVLAWALIYSWVFSVAIQLSVGEWPTGIVGILVRPFYALYASPLDTLGFSLIAVLPLRHWSKQLVAWQQPDRRSVVKRVTALISDFAHGQLSYAQFFWYGSCVLGPLLGLLISGLLASFHNPALALLATLAIFSFWTFLLLKLLEAADRQQVAVVWQFLAIILVSGCLVGAAVAAFVQISAL